jgi:PadR family transcriptional regulator PadR
MTKMAFPNAAGIQRALDFFILDTLSSEPMHTSAIERQIAHKTRGLFEKLRLNPGSFPAALQRLERAGLLDAEWRQMGDSSREKTYSLTPAGKEQLAAEWTERKSALAVWVEGSTLDDSFRKFLESHKDLDR